MKEIRYIMIGLVGDDQEISSFTDTLFDIDPLGNIHGDATFIKCDTILFGIINMAKGYGLGGNFGQCTYCPKDVEAVISFNVSNKDKRKYKKDCAEKNSLFIPYNKNTMDAKMCLTDIYIDLSADKLLISDVNIKGTLLGLANKDTASIFTSLDVPQDVLDHIDQYFIDATFKYDPISFTFFKSAINNTRMQIEACSEEEEEASGYTI
jgi:hypothetical protein